MMGVFGNGIEQSSPVRCNNYGVKNIQLYVYVSREKATSNPRPYY